MSDVRDREILTREELTAILADIEGGQLDSGARSRLAEPFRPGRERSQTPPPKAPQLRESVEALAAAWGKQLASQHQRRIGCSVIGFEEVATDEFLETLLPSDRLALFEVSPPSARGFVLVSRPLAFGLLSLAFGGRRIAEQPVPTRNYTRIETRFLRRIAAELLTSVEAEWKSWCPADARMIDLVDPVDLPGQVPASMYVASLDLSGLVAIGRIRIGFPPPAFPERSARESSEGTGAGELAAVLPDLRVRVRAEIGSTELTLAELGRLRAGDVLPLRPSTQKGFVIRIEDAAKFRATRGSVGGRLAVQVVERIERLGEDQ